MKRTRILAVVLTVVMLLAVMPFSAVSAAGKVWDGSVASSFASGSGTEDDPYIITTGAELAYMGAIDTTGLYFELANDIVLNDTSAANWYETANDWVYIEIYGYFNGNGYTVSGLCYNPDEVTSDDSYIGLFGYAESATIENINVEDAYLVGSYCIGGILGEGYDAVSINNCYFDGTIKAYMYEYVASDGSTQMVGGGYAAGIAGDLYGEEDYESYITNCVNYGDIYTESYNAAGIAGAIEEYCYVEYCQNYGNISGRSYSGGIVGEAWGEYYVDSEAESIDYWISWVYSCENYGAVSGNADYESYYIGGIVGYIETAVVEYCRNFGDVTAGYDVGGIVGEAYRMNYLEGLVNYGEVSGNNYVGGIVGDQNGDSETYTSGNEYVLYTEGRMLVNHGDVIGIDDEENDYYSYRIGGIAGNTDFGGYHYLYNYGDISGFEEVGGIVGRVSDSNYLSYCYNGGNVTGGDYSSGGIVGYAEPNEDGIEIYGATNNGDVYGLNYVGGIVGYIDAYEGADVNISECWNKGAIEGSCCVAGIVGYANYGYVSDCLNDGTISVFYDENAYCPCGGGIVGEGDDGAVISNCVNAGDFESAAENATFGGIAASYMDAITIENCYYYESNEYLGVAEYYAYEMEDYEALTEEMEGVTALDISEMKTEATFVNFDFESIWSMGSEHPELVNAVSSILGDVNFDGVVDKKDYAIVKRACFGTAELSMDESLAADANRDGVVDKKDYALIKRACFGTAEIA